MSSIDLNTDTSLELDVYGDSIGDEGVRELLRLNTTLTSLTLGYNAIRDKGAKDLSLNTTLTSLDLVHNYVRDEGAKAFALNTTLTCLNLWGNKINNEGAKALALNTTLTSLSLNYNQIGDDGAKALALNTTLTSLYLSYNKIGDEGAIALSLNTLLTNLALLYNKIGDEGIRALSLNTSLTYLNLIWNAIGNEGARALSLNTSLTSLYLDDNYKITDKTLLTTIQARLELNKKQLVQRRSQFLQSMIILTRDANNVNSESRWRRLPPDVRRYILHHAYAGWSLGIPPKAKEKCGRFILDNMETINLMIREKIPWTISYRENYTQFYLRTQRVA